MSDMQQTIGIVIKADGTVELANGMKLSSAQIKGVANELDTLATRLDKVDKAEKATATATADAADKVVDAGKAVEETGGKFEDATGKVIDAGKAVVQAGKDFVEGDFVGAGRNVGTVAAAAGGLTVQMLAILGVGAAVALVLAGVGAAALTGAREQRQLNDALVLTGNFAGIATGRLDTMASSLAGAINGSVGASRDVLASLTATGQFTVTSLTEVASAVQLVARFSGETNSTVQGHFKGMANGVAQWAAKANESYHFLDLATYRYIQQLEEQGNKQEAMRVTSVALSNHLGNDMTRNLGVLERAWNAVGRAVSSAIASMKELGKSNSTADGIAQTEEQLRMARSGLGARSASGQTRIAGLEDQLAAQREVARLEARGLVAQTERAQAVERGIVAIKDWGKLVESNLTKEERLTKQIQEIRKAGRDSGQSESAIEALVAKAKAKDAGAPKAVQDSAAERYLQALRDSNAAVLAQLQSEDKLTAAQQKQAEFQQLIADLKEKRVLTADQKSLLAHADTINAQLRENVLAEELLKIKNEDAKNDKKRLEDLKQYANAVTGVMAAIESSQRGRGEQYDRTLSVFGMGSEAREQMESTKSIYKEFQRYQDQIAKAAGANGTVGTDQYLRDVAAVREQLNLALREHDRYYAELKAKQGDWTNGATEALANYLSSAQNVAAQTKDLFSNAFKGMEDALVSFVMTGKGNFTTLANSIVADLIRIQVRAALANAAGGSGGWLSAIFGGGSTSVAGATVSNSFMSSVGMTSTGMVPMAKGGVFSSPSLSAYSGGVYDRPQPFMFANGAGIFAEAGPEAIMPLQRGPNGKLGVASSGGGSSVQVELNVQNHGAPAKATVEQTPLPGGGIRLDLMLEQIEDALAEKVAYGGGNISRALESRYGLRTAVT